MIKRVLACVLDIYLVTLIQLLMYTLYNFFRVGQFRLSMLYVIDDFRILFVFFFLLYYFISEYLFRKTIGKRIFKLEVIFTRRDLKTIIIRTIIRLVPIDVFFILIYKKTLHDILSKTDVVETKKVQE
ncbi:RDD family protein [Chryseobacterium sp. MP_3.2]|uniref:RDD family protein n=1 Tax=Chryseobacterium sp. MP_3.2 TaxID=3071712 RepID=UPI002E031894|nr:cellulose synthase/poly-beta-1,6-N-acetylglucosamine synthase-like glycosyltransferase [Chryseobacterium sp. MP_3.2]